MRLITISIRETTMSFRAGMGWFLHIITWDTKEPRDKGELTSGNLPESQRER